MNRPFILGLSGAAIVGAAIGLTYAVDKEPAKETAAVLKTPEPSANPPISDKRKSPVSSRDTAAIEKTPERIVKSPIPNKRQLADSPRRKLSVLETPKRSTNPPVSNRRQSPDSPRHIAAILKTPERSNDDTAPKSRQSAVSATLNGNVGVKNEISGTSDRAVPRKPTFDVVRVNPRGDAVIAGRASPNAAVVVRDGEKEIGKAKADARGEWVVIPKQPLPKGTRELTLSAQSRDGTATQSDQNVVIVIPDPTTGNAAKSGSNRAPGALAVLVPRKGNAGSVVIQKPSAASRASLEATAVGTRSAAPVSIDSVDYDDAGNVTISGNASPRAPLSVYIDNQHAASGVSDRQGRWRVVPGGELAPGKYTLRVDNVGDGGKVIGRAETQFVRAAPVATAPADTVVSVEPGNSLWRIARRIYGSGIQYTVIFDANREQIRDPDLIYPGQVFFVPHVN